MKQITIDGNNFSNEEEFYSEIDKLLTRDLGWKTGHNLDAFNDILRGGFGVHDPGEELIITWVSAGKSRKELGEQLFNTIVEIILDCDNSGHDCILKIEE
jgi:RNAse (barnase) inhibitor barstar